jgi:hypothetical protein
LSDAEGVDEDSGESFEEAHGTMVRPPVLGSVHRLGVRDIQWVQAAWWLRCLPWAGAEIRLGSDDAFRCRDASQGDCNYGYCCRYPEC